MSSQRHDGDLVREWLDESYEAQREPARFLEHLVDAVPDTPQRRRRWWQGAGSWRIQTPSARETTEYQPSPIPASNGHTPTVRGRTQTMFSPAKAITAGALVFAIGGAYLVAGLPGAKEALEPGAESPQARPVEYAAIPDGTYAVTLTDEDAVRTGFPHECLVAGKENTVTVTLVIEGTDWTEIQACSDGEPPFVGSHGTLRYEGDDVIFTEPDVPGHVSYAWQSDGTKLSLRLLEADPQYAPTEVLRFLFENDFIREKG